MKNDPTGRSSTYNKPFKTIKLTQNESPIEVL